VEKWGLQPWRSGTFKFSTDPELEAKIRAGLEPLTPHDLRRTCASLAISNGASPLVVARLLGHSDLSVKLKVYAGLFDRDLDNLFAGADRAVFRPAAASVRPETDSGVSTVRSIRAEKAL
jgi:hypothetical protein